MTVASFIPVSLLLEDVGVWPSDGLELGGGMSALDRVGVKDIGIADAELQTTARFTIVVDGEIAIQVPGFNAISLVIGSTGTQSEFRLEVELRPAVIVRLVDASIALRFEQDILRPVRQVDNRFELDPTQPYVEIRLTATLVFDGEALRLEETPTLSLDYCMIGTTGVVIQAATMKLDLSATAGFAEAEAAGLGSSWKGLFIPDAAIHLPEGLSSALPSDLHFSNCFIGSGGFTGVVQVESPQTGDLYGMPFDLERARFDIRQNSLVECRVLGQLTLSFFDEPLDVEIGFDLDGRLLIGVGSDDGLATLEKPGVLRLELASVGFEVVDGLVGAHLSGALTPLFGDIDWPTFVINDLSIDSHGHVKVAGGWLDFPTPISFELYGFRAEVARIGFGTEDDGTRWIGLSASMQFIQSFALGGSVEGLKIKWKGSDVSLELRGIGVELLIPKTLALAGKLELIDEGTRTGFKGAVKLHVLPTNLAIDAQLLIGRNSESPSYSFAYIFIAAELPVGIPLLNTGLAFYGFAGLVGYNVAPAKGPDEPWFDGWYLKPPVGVSSVDKWRDERDAFALGVGTTIGTAADNGYAFHGKFLLVLVLPGPLILLDGQASFLQARGAGEPVFLSLAIFDGRAGTLLFNVQAHYAYTETGDLIDITGFAEAFFDFAHPKKWHLYLGMDTPDAKRIRANIISLFEANSYFMLTHTGVRMGAWFGLDRKWKYGPLKVTLEAWIEGAASVSWAPKQFEGSLTLNGDVRLKAFGVGTSLNVRALLEARAPHPYRVHAEFRVKMNLPWPLPDPKAKVKMTWEEELPPPTPRPLEILGLEHLKVSEKWVMGSSAANAPVVPLDAKPVLSFQRRMTDHTGLATNALPSASERVGGYRFRYRLEEVLLEKRASAGEAWVDATTPSAASLPAGNLWTTWLAAPAASSDPSPQGVPPMTKVMMWSRTPFDYGREAPGTAVEDGFLDENPSWPCGFDWTPMSECIEFEDRPSGPMPPFSHFKRVVIAARDGKIVKWGGDWITVKQAATISGQAPHRPHSRVLPQRIPAFRIVFPSHAAIALLYLGRGTDGFYMVPGGDPQQLLYVQEPVEVHAEPGNLAYVDLWGTVALLRVCWVARDEWDRVQDGVLSSAQLGTNATDAMTADAELLQPHRQYRMTVTTRVERSSNGGGSWQTADTYTDSGYFQTHSPPGLSIDTNGSELAPTGDSEHYPSRGPLKDLTEYVHRTVPASGARPVYRGYDVGVEFNESYVEPMYLLAGSPLVLQLHDSNGQPVPDSSGEPLNLMGQWRPLDDAQLGEVARAGETDWLARLADGGCIGAGAQDAAPPPAQGLWAGHPRLLLEPNVVYRAVLGPLAPIAVVPLATDGLIVRTIDGWPMMVQLTGSPSERLEQIHSSGTANKLLIAAGTIMETSLGAQEGVFAFDIAQAGEILALEAITAEVVPEAAPATLARVYDWTFTTSRFATFVHHLHSFLDDPRSLHAELGQPSGDLLTPAELTWLETLVAARPLGASAYALANRQELRDEEGRQFDRVIALFELQGRPLPERVHATILDDATRSYGVLLESPEPFAWERIVLAAARGAESAESLLDEASPLKMISAGFAASAASSDLVNEYVDLLVLQSTDLAGTTVQTEDGADIWNDYYTFAGGEITPEGTVIRIHTGSGTDDANPVAEVEHHYAADAGGGGARRFGADTVRMRLLDPDARALHARVLARTFSGSTFRVVRSRDGTRVLLFFPSVTSAVGNVLANTLRLTWTFHRNILPEEPILRRAGSDRDEVTSLDIAIS